MFIKTGLMIHDFLQTCNSYDREIYNREYFKATPCPKCPAVGRFKMHGTYSRHAIYYELNVLKCELLEIKRIKCVSCGTTHAVLPGDIIPYKALSLLVLMSIIISYYLDKKPVLKIAERIGFSFQYIYTAIRTFLLHMNNIAMHFREIRAESIPTTLDAAATLSLIVKPYMGFQYGYIEKNLRACFMCKFFKRPGAPPSGIYRPLGGDNITLE